MAQSSETSTNLQRTALFDLCVQQKARMTAFAGWEMPVQFQGLKLEHEAVRNSVGMFDISHMGKFNLKGQNLVKELQKLVPSDLGRLKPGQAQYSVFLNEQAGIIDDIIFYYQGQDATGEQLGFMIVNAATLTKDRDWLQSHLSSDITLEDISPERVLLAVQGHQAITSLQPFVLDDLSAIPTFGHLTTQVLGEPALIARTGYTGEDGFEVMVIPEIGRQLWRSLIEQGVTPCGLGARDTLRLEAALCLYGQDIDDSTTPLEAGLGWLVHLDTKGDFIGRNILEKQKQEGVTRRLVGLQMPDRYIARHGYPVIYQGATVGNVTSGTLAPTVNRAIALAFVPQSLSKIGQELEVEIRGKNYPTKVVKKPFYRSPWRK